MIFAFFGYAGCVFVGFLAGLLTFKRSDRWCPACGRTTVEIRHQHQAHT